MEEAGVFIGYDRACVYCQLVEYRRRSSEFSFNIGKVGDASIFGASLVVFHSFNDETVKSIAGRDSANKGSNNQRFPELPNGRPHVVKQN